MLTPMTRLIGLLTNTEEKKNKNAYKKELY